MIISSKDNETVKEIKKMKMKKYRKDKFIIEGIKMISEAINENIDIDLIVLEEDFDCKIDISKYNSIIVSKKIFSDLTDVVTPQGILAIVKKKEDVKINYNAEYVIALDDIQDPGNLGTIIRTADSANLKQIIVSKGTVSAYSSKVIRSTMGAIFRVQVVEVDDLEEELMNFKKNNFEIVTTTLDGNKSIFEIDYRKKVVVIGNEANGVRNSIQDIADYKAKIPMRGKTESLNASIATGIMIYEYVRQTEKK